MRSRLLLLLFCVLTSDFICQEEVDADTEKHSRFSIQAEGAPKIAEIISSAFLGLEFDVLNKPDKPFRFNLKSGLGYIFYRIYGVTEGIGGYVGTSFLFGRKHSAEVNLGLFRGNDINSEGSPFDIDGSSNSTGPFTYPIITLGYRYTNPKGNIYKCGVGTTGIYLGIGMPLKPAIPTSRD